MSTAEFIANPYAGRWKAKAAIPSIHRACETLKLECELVVTEGPDQGFALVRQAAGPGPQRRVVGRVLQCCVVAAGRGQARVQQFSI